MNTLVPLEYYFTLYLNLLLLIALSIHLQANRTDWLDQKNLKSKNAVGIALLIFTIVYIGTRPISGKYFIDMRTYAESFAVYVEGGEIPINKDVYFEYFMKWSSGIMSVATFFFLCAILYVLPMYFFCRKIFKDYWFYAFMMLVMSFTFWSAGVNGIRSGIATSFVLVAIAYADRKALSIILFLIALAFHKSMALVIAAYVVTAYFRHTNWLIAAWFFAILLSLALGGFFEGVFSGFGLIEDERISNYMSGEVDEFEVAVGRTGFRWDFLLFSASAVAAGWFFKNKKGYEDYVYDRILGTYLITNSFWILVIRTPFSNRFAYLSWFIMGIVIVYPLLKNRFYDNQHVVVARVIFVFFLFTYVMSML
ncbi:EpsG family protein [Flavobacterium sp.]|uniref:EpsG family protein n=1 Tax=Flavobacterium sp. TaxID=239 RepID=UPI0025C10A89|nr:EpsG family protein [Flavobacterium sp.]